MKKAGQFYCPAFFCNMMKNEEILQYLKEKADEEYRQFQKKLIPGAHEILGVRLPDLRFLAKKIAQGDWRGYLQEADSGYFEEIMLQGLVIGAAQIELQELTPYIEAFIPKINNWSVCDSFCASLKAAKKYPQEMWDFIQPYLRDKRPFYIRFGIVMLLDYFIEKERLKDVFQILRTVSHSDYYVRMAVAWALSLCFIRFPEPTWEFLSHTEIEKDILKKTVRKIIDSYRVSKAWKDKIRSLLR